MFIGDGKDKTVITGSKSIMDNVTTFHTASFGKFQTSVSFTFNFCGNFVC